MNKTFSGELNFPIFLHKKISDVTQSRPDLRQQLGMVLRRLAAHGRGHPKSCQGKNRGWWRTPLKGMHFYLWWTDQNSPQCRNITFSNRKCIVARAVRHHDDHGHLSVGTEKDYWQLQASDIEDEKERLVGSPWTPDQRKFIHDSSTVRYIYGQPGSGKTASLWRAVETSRGQRVLYLTWSRQLADYAKQRFSTFAPAALHIDTLDFTHFLSIVCGSDIKRSTLNENIELLKTIIADAQLHPYKLGSWVERPYALFAELRAILIGRAISNATDYADAGFLRRLSDSKYKSLRSGPEGVGLPAVTALLNNVIPAIWNDERLELVFPELSAACKALQRLEQGNFPPDLVIYDHIAVDEVQDLTLLEMATVVSLCQALKEKRQDGMWTYLLLAGDEGQTVRPTSFQWARLSDLIYGKLKIRPKKFSLKSGNLRNPDERINKIISEISYHQLIRQWRPRRQISNDQNQGSIGQNQESHLFHVEIIDEFAAVEFLRNLAMMEMENAFSLCVLSLDHEIPVWIPESLKNMVQTPAQTKGLEYQVVCILNLGSRLKKLNALGNQIQDLEAQAARTDIDQLRVALSRTTETLTFVDISPSPEDTDLSRGLLGITVTHSPSEWMEIVSMSSSGTSLDDRVQQLLEEARNVRDLRPERTWYCIQTAVSLITAQSDPHTIDRTVEQEARTILLETSARFLVDGIPTGVDQNDVVKAVREIVNVQGNERQAKAFRYLTDWTKHRTSSPIPLLQALRDLGSQGEWLQQSLISVSQTLNQMLETCAATLSEAACFSQDIEGWLQGINYKGDMSDRAQKLRRLAFDTLIRAGYTQQAQAVLSMLPSSETNRRCALRLVRQLMEETRTLGDRRPAQAWQCIQTAVGLIAEVKLHTMDKAVEQEARATLLKMAAYFLVNGMPEGIGQGDVIKTVQEILNVQGDKRQVEAFRHLRDWAKHQVLVSAELLQAVHSLDSEGEWLRQALTSILETNRGRIQQLTEKARTTRDLYPAQAWQSIQTAVSLIAEADPGTMEETVEQEARTVLLEMAARFLVDGVPEGIDQSEVVKAPRAILSVQGNERQVEAFRHFRNWTERRTSAPITLLQALRGLGNEGEWLRQALASVSHDLNQALETGAAAPSEAARFSQDVEGWLQALDYEGGISDRARQLRLLAFNTLLQADHTKQAQTVLSMISPEDRSRVARDWFSQGLAAMEKLAFRKAVNCFERALVIDPNYVEAHCKRMEANRGRIRQLAKEARTTCDLYPVRAWQSIQTAVGLIVNDPTMDKTVEQEARTVLLEMAAYFLVSGMPEGIGPNDVVKVAQEILRIQGDERQEEAFRHLCNWAERRTSSPLALLQALRDLGSDGEWLQRTLTSVSQTLNQALETCAATLSEVACFSQDIEGWLQRINYKGDMSDRARQLRLLAFDTLIQADRTKQAQTVLLMLPPEDRSRVARDWFSQGLAAMEKLAFRKAVSCFERTLVIDPNYIEAHCKRVEANRGRIRQLAKEARTTCDLYPVRAWQSIQTAVGLIVNDPDTKDRTVEQEARTGLLEMAAYFLVSGMPEGIGQNDVAKVARTILRIQGDERQEEAFRHLCNWAERRTSSPLALLQALRDLGSDGEWLQRSLTSVSQTLNQALETCAATLSEAACFSQDIESWLQRINYKGDMSDRARQLRLLVFDTLIQADRTKQAQTVLSMLPEKDASRLAKDWFSQGMALMERQLSKQTLKYANGRRNRNRRRTMERQSSKQAKQSSKQALKCFDRALAANPNYAEAYVKRGELHFSRGRGSALRRRGDHIKTVRHYTKAMDDFDQAIKLYEGQAEQTQEASQNCKRVKQLKNEVQKVVLETDQDQLGLGVREMHDVMDNINEIELNNKDSYWD